MNNGNQNPASLFNQISDTMDACRKVQMDALKQFSQVQLDFLNLCMECNSAQIQRLAKAETPADIVSAESDVASEYMNKFFSNGQQMFEALGKLQNEMVNLLQNNNGLLHTDITSDKEPRTTKKSAPAIQ